MGSNYFVFRDTSKDFEVNIRQCCVSGPKVSMSRMAHVMLKKLAGNRIFCLPDVFNVKARCAASNL